ncbi:hypothetical protein AALB16_03775 [Lachnospiraceae bacterium 62-35]
MNDWKKDPRLKEMDRKKLDMLDEFAEKVKQTPKNRLIPSLLTFSMEAQSKGISFSDSETDIIVSILAADMSPQERKKIDILKMFSRQITKPE